MVQLIENDCADIRIVESNLRITYVWEMFHPIIAFPYGVALQPYVPTVTSTDVKSKH